jgi:hypothetical protein
MKPKPNIRIVRIDLPLEYVVSDVENVEQLEELRGSANQSFLESDSDIFLIKPGIVYRYQKPEALPRIIPVEKLELNPDRYSAKIQLSPEQLMAFARRERLFLFETKDGFFIPSDTILYAEKKKAKES